MKKVLMIQIIAMFIACGFMLTGCNEFQASSASQNGASGTVDENLSHVDMDALNKDLDGVDVSVAEVEKELANINLPILGAASAQQGLDKTLRGIFEKLVGVVKSAFDRVTVLEDSIRARVAKLNPLNPVHMLAIAKLNEALSYLENLKGNLSDKFHVITDRMTDLVKSLDSKVSAMDPKNPLTWVVAIYWQKVRMVLMENIDRIAAMIP